MPETDALRWVWEWAVWKRLVVRVSGEFYVGFE